jgi:hypothetical protein
MSYPIPVFLQPKQGLITISFRPSDMRQINVLPKTCIQPTQKRINNHLFLSFKPEAFSCRTHNLQPTQLRIDHFISVALHQNFIIATFGNTTRSGVRGIFTCNVAIT